MRCIGSGPMTSFYFRGSSIFEVVRGTREHELKRRKRSWDDAGNQILLWMAGDNRRCSNGKIIGDEWLHPPPEWCSVLAYGVYGSTGRPSCHSNQMSTNFI